MTGVVDKYSPRHPLATGLDFDAVNATEEGVFSAHKAISASFVSTETELITGIRPFLRSWGTNTHGIVEITEAGDEVTGPTTYSDFYVDTSQPITDAPGLAPPVTAVGAGSYGAALTGPNLQDGAYCWYSGNGAQLLDILFDVSAGIPSGHRVLHIQVLAYSHIFNGAGWFILQAYQASLPFTTPFKVNVGAWQPGTSGWPVGGVDLGEINPITNQLWTPSNMANFGSPSAAGIKFACFYQGTGTPNLDALWIRVWHAPENRVAYGNFFMTEVDPGTNKEYFRDIPIYGVAEGYVNNWAKQGSHTYTVTMRRNCGANSPQTGAYSWRGLEANQGGPGLPPAGSAIRTVGDHGDVGATNTEAVLQPGFSFSTDELTPIAPERSYHLLFNRSDGTYSSDSQSYTGHISTPVGFPTWDPQQSFEMPVDIPSGTPFSQMSFLAEKVGSPTSNLTVSIRDVSSLLVSVTFTPDDWDNADPLGITDSVRLLKATFPTPLLMTGGGVYFITWSVDSPPADSSNYWGISFMACPDANGDVMASPGNAVGLVGSYEGPSTAWGKFWATDTQLVSVGDYSFTFYEGPDGPSGFSATVNQQPLPDVIIDACLPLDNGVVITEVDYAALTWTPVTTSQVPANDFAYYEIQRLTSFEDGTWVSIAKISDQTVGFFNDVEARRNTLNSYRIRTVRVDGGESQWSSTSSCTPVTRGCELVFASNESPQSTLAYPEVYDAATADRLWTFTETNDVTFKALYGRDGEIAVFPQERKLDEFTRTVLVAPKIPTTGGGRAAFEALRDLSRAVLSYVCVLDHNGGQFLANVRVQDGTDSEPLGNHRATVVVHELTTVPSTPDATVL